MFDAYRDKEKRKEYLQIWRGQTKDKQKRWYENWLTKNGEKYKEYKAEWYISNAKRIKEHREVERQLVLKHYGNKCNCCGEANAFFLTIDHVNNDGYKDSRNRSATLISKIIKMGFPDIYQIMCYNCNCGKARNGGICPHYN